MIIRWSVVLDSWLQAKSIFLRFLFVFFSLPYIVRQAAWLFLKELTEFCKWPTMLKSHKLLPTLLLLKFFLS